MNESALSSDVIRQAIAAAKQRRHALGPSIGNARAIVELDALYEQNIAELEQYLAHIDAFIDALKKELQALLNLKTAWASEAERLMGEVIRLRQERRTLEVDQRTARVYADEELRGLRSLVREANGQLQGIRDAIAAEQRRQTAITKRRRSADSRYSNPPK